MNAPDVPLRLVFDTSAIRNLQAAMLPALLDALAARGAELWIPATVRFELARQQAARAERDEFEFSRAPEIQWLIWVRQAAHLGITVRDAPFDVPEAEALIRYFASSGVDYATVKAWKCWSDGAALRNHLLDAVLARAPSGKLPPHSDRQVMVLKSELADAVVRWRSQEAPASAGKVSGTIDWLHLGIALARDATLVADDLGPEYPVDHSWTLNQLCDRLKVAR